MGESLSIMRWQYIKEEDDFALKMKIYRARRSEGYLYHLKVIQPTSGNHTLNIACWNCDVG